MKDERRYGSVYDKCNTGFRGLFQGRFSSLKQKEEIPPSLSKPIDYLYRLSSSPDSPKPSLTLSNSKKAKKAALSIILSFRRDKTPSFRSGIGRIVCPYKDVVIKVPRRLNDPECLEQSWNELLFHLDYVRYSPQKHLFTPLVSFLLLPLSLKDLEDEPFSTISYAPILFFKRVTPITHHLLASLEVGSYGDIQDLIVGHYTDEDRAVEFEEELDSLLEDSSIDDIYDHLFNWGIDRYGDLVILDCGYQDHTFSRDFSSLGLSPEEEKKVSDSFSSRYRHCWVS